MKTLVLLLALCATRMVGAQSPASPRIELAALPDAVRGKQIADLKWGMFICWSFSTFSGKEWTPGVKDITLFAAKDCDTDQWARTAREANMGYILFLTKHHDGFCLWDTQTTDRKVTKAPLGRDVLAELRQSCDKYGIKLALYFSEGEFSDHKNYHPGGYTAEMKKAQLKELLTRYGPIEYIWFDHAQGTGGLSHAETDKWVRQIQPDCFSGFNNGAAAGRIVLRERGKAGPIGGEGLNWNAGQDANEKKYAYTVAEFTYPLLGKHSGAGKTGEEGADWFYSKPRYDNMCLPAKQIYNDYLGAVKFGNIFSLDVGPDYQGKLREIDVKTLREVGKMIRGEIKVPVPLAGKATASGCWQDDPKFGPRNATDGNPATRWGAPEHSRAGWLEIDLGTTKSVSHAMADEAGFNRVRKFEILAMVNGGWQSVSSGTTLGANKEIYFPAPVNARVFRLNITGADEVPTIGEFQVFE